MSLASRIAGPPIPSESIEEAPIRTFWFSVDRVGAGVPLGIVQAAETLPPFTNSTFRA